MQPVLVENLSVNYEKSPALWDINFSLGTHELVGIIGPNGAGKSTLLKAMMDFIKPLSGQTIFFGESNIEKVRSRIAYIPQIQAIDWDFPITAIEVVTMGGYHQASFLKWPTKAGKGKAMDILKKLQMERFAHKPISQLSGGQKQKLFIGRALMQNADLFFFDEPFVGIDHTTQQQLVDLFKSMRKEGKTLVIVHHDLSTVESIFTHVIILNTYLVAKGGTQEVFNVENLKKAYGQSETILEKLLNTVSKEQ